MGISSVYQKEKAMKFCFIEKHMAFEKYKLSLTV